MTDLTRPTVQWRELKRQEAHRFAAGLLSSDERVMERGFPDVLLDRIDLVLDAYAAFVARLPTTPDGYLAVTGAIKTLILALNDINTLDGRRWFDTAEREALCGYIDEVIVRHGIDIDALARSHGVDRHDLGDEWRDW